VAPHIEAVERIGGAGDLGEAGAMAEPVFWK
jgi:hypothetical protein